MTALFFFLFFFYVLVMIIKNELITLLITLGLLTKQGKSIEINANKSGQQMLLPCLLFLLTRDMSEI